MVSHNKAQIQAKLRAIPAMNMLLDHPHTHELTPMYGYDRVHQALRDVLDHARVAIQQGDDVTLAVESLISTAQSLLKDRHAPTLQTVINATGVIIHTNLGRAPLSEASRQAVELMAHQYNTLEFDITTGKRGSRYIHAEQLLCDLTGAEAALVVNNNAAALVLLLAALARGKEVIISRGQLVEIGGGFRIPDIMQQGGATLVEVGTTNRTHIHDYTHAVTEHTAMFLRIHSSNFRQIGFVEQPSLEAMAQAAHARGALFVDDIGSGALLDTTPFGLLPEPTVQASLAADADLVCFSGDKLLGGPQAGILVGRADIIDQLKAHPFARAMRADKLCYAALNATLAHYQRDEALTHIPIWRMMSLTPDDIRARVLVWQHQLQQAGITTTCQSSQSTVGGGSLPGTELPTMALVLDVPSPDDFLMYLRAQASPIIARIANDRVWFDPRTVLPEQDALLLIGIQQAWAMI